MRVAVLGAGSWGTALAATLARHGSDVSLWGRDAAQMIAMAGARRNARYLPELQLPDDLRCLHDLAEALTDTDLALIVVPSHAFAELLAQLAPLLPARTGIAWATKGFEPGTGRFLHELVAARFPGRPAAVVTGPSFAREVAQGLPTALTVHALDAGFAQQLATLLHGPALRAYSGADMLGAELGGAMKNVLAVATGAADGMQLGLNARAGLITRGMNEMLRLGVALGARAETLIGLAGLGDLVLTCTGDLSRNRTVGLKLGQGMTISAILAEMRMVAEGVKTTKSAKALAAKQGVEMPILEQVYQVLYEDKPCQAAVRDLLARDQKEEMDYGV